MKCKILIMFMALFMILFLVGGCIKVTETEETPPTEAGENITIGEEPQQEIPQEEEERVMSEELTQLLAKAAQKVTSMSYLYYGPPEDQIGYGFSVRGNKIKVVLPAMVKVGMDKFYDTLYLNTEKKSAFAYCEAAGCTDKKTAFSVKYADYIRDTPLDKLKLVEYGEIKGDEAIESRQTKVVLFEGKNVTGKMWIDTFSGLPLKVEETAKGNTIKTEYRNLGVNSVMEVDVTR